MKAFELGVTTVEEVMKDPIQKTRMNMVFHERCTLCLGP
jgi:hypothetical protein